MILNYISTKAKVYTLKELILLEIEAYLTWIFRGLPSFLGFIPRYFIYKLLCRKLDSFCIVQPNVFINHCFRLSVGRNFVVNSNTYINAVGGITIGDNVLIGVNVVISSGVHNYTDRNVPVTLQPITPKQITIEDDVWIGANAVILPGVTLRKGTVVGAGAVVTKSTESYSVVAGVPAKKIKNRTLM